MLLIVLITALAVATMLLSTLITATMVVVLPSGGSLLGRKLFFLSILPFWLDGVIMMSPALLTDAVLTSLGSLAIVVGVALIGLGEV